VVALRSAVFRQMPERFANEGRGEDRENASRRFFPPDCVGLCSFVLSQVPTRIKLRQRQTAIAVYLQVSRNL